MVHVMRERLDGVDATPALEASALKNNSLATLLLLQRGCLPVAPSPPVNSSALSTERMVRALIERPIFSALPYYLHHLPPLDPPDVMEKRVIRLMKKTFFPFVILDEFGRRLYEAKNIDGAFVVWGYLAELGFFEARIARLVLVLNEEVRLPFMTEQEQLAWAFDQVRLFQQETHGRKVFVRFNGFALRSLALRVFPTNATHAIELLTDALASGDGTAGLHLALIYEYGIAVPKNTTRADELAQHFAQRTPYLKNVILVNRLFDALSRWLADYWAVVGAAYLALVVLFVLL